MFISIFQPVFMDHGKNTPEGQRLTETPAAAVVAQGSSPYLIQFVNTGADRSELAVWDTANCKHPIKDAPIVDLGEREKVINYELKQMLQLCLVCLLSSFLSMEEKVADVCQDFFAVCSFCLFPIPRELSCLSAHSRPTSRTDSYQAWVELSHSPSRATDTSTQQKKNQWGL